MLDIGRTGSHNAVISPNLKCASSNHISLVSMAKAQGLNRPPALDDRANNGTVTNYFLSFIPNMDMSLLNRAQVLLIKQYHMRHGIHAKSSTKGNAIYISLLLCISNDVHPHPGPPRGGPKYPCGVCRKAVRWSSTRKAVACDAFDVWYHTDCMGMNSDTYEALNQTNVTWICANCDTPNHSSLLDSHIDACINSFSPLSCIDSDSSKSTNSSIPGNTHIGSPGPPILRSSPIQPSTCKPNTRPLKILSVNLQSLPAKKEVFWEAVDACAPDIIIANETWLKPTIHTSEVMPPGFNTLRKDRADGYGGVLLAVSREFTDNQITTDTDKEIIATKISTECKKTSLVIVSVYRPPNTDIDYALDLCSKIKHIVNTNRSATIWISGDLNLPDIDWKTESIEGHQNSNAINTAFLSAFQELGLTQIVDFPTRLHNTLDVFLTNRPSMISNCTPLPGVSDHEMMLTISDVQAKRLKPVSRKILLWNKADIQNIRNDLSTFSSNYLTSVTINTPVEEQWRIISRHLTQTIDNLVPSKMSTTRFNQPWITR